MTEAPASMGSCTAHTRSGEEVHVADTFVRSRFEATAEDSLAAYAEYILREEHVDFIHTVTEAGWEGRGIASALAEGALDLVRRANRRVIPHCPFISAYIHRHSEFADLVDDEHRSLIRPPSHE